MGSTPAVRRGVAILRRMANETPYTERVLDWLEAHPGRHSPAEVAAGTGESVTWTANTLRYLANSRQIYRRRHRTKRNGPGASTYGL